MSKSNLPPLSHVDKDLKMGFSEKVEINHTKCDHDPQVISGNEIRCSKCGAGWTGTKIPELLQAFLNKKS